VRVEEIVATLNRSAIVVKAGQPFLDWLHVADPTSRTLTLRVCGNWFSNRQFT
jgi:hypothetical protein